MESFTGILRKPIDLSDAPARGLRATFALPPDENDLLCYATSEIMARWKAFDEMFQLDPKASDIWVQRSKALIKRALKIDPSDPHWWKRLAICMAKGRVPGFSLQKTTKKKHGAPCQWSDERLAELWADIEFLRKTTKLSVQKICEKLPRSKGYARRWGDCTSGALRKQYSRANGLRLEWRFKCILSGGQALSASTPIDLKEAAIERHALKISFK